AAMGQFDLEPLDITDLLDPGLPARLDRLDVVYANCGPLTALLLAVRERHGLPVRVIREVRTSGWIGYAFQEWVASPLHRPDDRCAHVAAHSMALWTGFRGEGGDVFHYPMLHGPRDPPRKGPPRVAGYFSRIAPHKGPRWLPSIVARLREAGWPLEKLVLGGATDSPTQRDGVVQALRASGVDVTMPGALNHARALAMMRSVDVVLFPSVSSLEGLGRVVPEALHAGCRVVASDWCGGRDLVAPAFRIPLASGTRSGSSREGFPMADLDLEHWNPPPWDAPCAMAEALASYRRDPDRTRALIAGRARDASPPPTGVRLSFDWPPPDKAAALDLCAALAKRVRAEARNRADLLDLGGAAKRSLIALGFAPTATFQV
ncbi:MAG: glycosyltransferase, partial [Deltaproteobacteria bacterium]|nr:glycosyltransferase [Deltaproteobacteria bacterium]MBW2256532.1 glycosyltransferase [Deltaproteobacteria bacterium]